MDKQCKSCRPTKIKTVQNVSTEEMDVVLEGGLGGIAVAVRQGSDMCYRCLDDCDCNPSACGSEGEDRGSCVQGTCSKRSCKAPLVCAASQTKEGDTQLVGTSHCGVPVDV